MRRLTTRRLGAWLAAPLVLLTLAVTAVPAAAATKPPKVFGVYTVYGSYGKKSHQTFSMTLYKDHTGKDHFGDTIEWTLDGKNLTMHFNVGAGESTYLGTKRASGFSTKKAPGTLSNVNGGTGTWYAVKVAA